MPVPIYKGDWLVEQPGSPSWTFGEEIKLVRTLRGRYDVALASAPGRGALGTGQAAGLRVLESTVQRERGGIGVLQITFGPIPGQPLPNVPLPPTEEYLQRGALDFAVDSHPLFASLSERTLANINTLINTAPTDHRYEDAFNELAELTGETKALAENLFRKHRRGVTVYVQYPPIFRRVSYYWADPSPLSGGGFIQTPIPQIISIPPDFQWLRNADNLQHNGTFFQLEEKWTGGKNIEADLYTP